MRAIVKIGVEVIAMVLGTVLGVYLIYQMVTYIGTERALKIGREHTYVLRAARGNIYDTNGNVLARSDTLFNLHLDCAVMKAGFRDSAKMEFVIGQLAARLAKVLTQKDSAAWQEHIYTGCKNGNKYLHIAKGVSKAIIDSVKTFPVFDLHQFRGGGIIEPVYRRVYPYDMLGRRTIGDIRCKTVDGFERSYDYVLSGRDGRKTIRHGRYEGRNINKVSEYIPSKDGSAVYTTLNMAMQALADSLLRRAIVDNEAIAEGCFVLMEKNGAIRAMVNLSQTEDGLFELRNMAIDKLCPPGSIGQIMTYAALLGDGYIHSFSDTIATRNGLIMRELPRDEHIVDYERRNSTSSISIRDGFAMSSRYVPGILANKFYGSAPGNFTAYLKAFYPDLDFDLDGLRKNVTPVPDSSEWSAKSLPVMAYGYGLYVTPLAILTFYNTLLNHGTMIKPFLVDGIMEQDKFVKRNDTADMGQIIPEQWADTLLRELKYASCSANFIGKSSLVQLPVSNKGHNNTEGMNRYATSCIGLFPECEPRYSAICVLYSKATSRPPYMGKMVAERVVEGFIKL